MIGYALPWALNYFSAPYFVLLRFLFGAFYEQKKKPKHTHVNRYETQSHAKQRQAGIEQERLDLSDNQGASGAVSKPPAPAIKQGAAIQPPQPRNLTAGELSYFRISLRQFAQSSSEPETAHATFLSDLLLHRIPTLPAELDRRILDVYMQLHVDTIIDRLPRMRAARNPSYIRQRIQRSVEALDRNNRLGLLRAALEQKKIDDQSALAYVRALVKDGLDPAIPLDRLSRVPVLAIPAAVEVSAPAPHEPAIGAKAAPARESPDQEAKRLIATLHTVGSDPEIKVGLVRSRLAQLFGSPLPPRIAAELNEGCVGAYISTVIANLAELPTSENPQIAYAAIQKAVTALEGLRQTRRLFTAPGLTEQGIRDHYDLRQAIERKYRQGLAFAADIPTRKLVKRAKRLSEGLATAADPAAMREDLARTLALLGAKQSLAYPGGITTADEMKIFIEDAAAKAQAAINLKKQSEEARLRFERFGQNSPGRLINPDQELSFLRNAVDTLFAGDVAQLAQSRYGWQQPITAAEMERELDRRHTQSMNLAAYQIMRDRGVRRPMGGWTSTALTNAQDLINTGFDPENLLHRAEIDARYEFMPAREQNLALVAELQREVPKNEALRFALVTLYFAYAEQIHQAMAEKTWARVEAAGGTAELDDRIARVRLEHREWADVKAILTLVAFGKMPPQADADASNSADEFFGRSTRPPIGRFPPPTAQENLGD